MKSVLLPFFLVFILITSGCSSYENVVSKNEAANTSVIKIGETGAIGSFSFVVNEVRETKELDGIESEGKFVLIEVTAENIGKESAVISSNLFSALDDYERKYDTYSGLIFLDEFKELSFENVNPGMKKTGYVIFEVPDDAIISRLAVADNIFDFGGADYIFFEL